MDKIEHLKEGERCAFCGKKATYLCDCPTAIIVTSLDFKQHTNTYDLPICEDCATKISNSFDIHFCPKCMKNIQQSIKGRNK